MKRIFTLISAIVIGISVTVAGTLSDIKSEIAQIEGVTIIDASQKTKVQEYSITGCELIMLPPESIDNVKSILSKIPEDMIFADVNDKEGTKATIWEEPEDGTSNGELLIYVNAKGQQMVVFAHGDLKAMEAGIHVD